jgi:hypothetical protein
MHAHGLRAKARNARAAPALCVAVGIAQTSVPMIRSSQTISTGATPPAARSKNHPNKR